MARESALRFTKEAGNTMIRRPETITPILQDLNPQDDYRGIHPEMQNIEPVDHELDGHPNSRGSPGRRKCFTTGARILKKSKRKKRARAI
jgi:hypothetical protein